MSEVREAFDGLDQKDLKFIEHYLFSLPSQGNVYSLILLNDQSECCKILVATLQGKVFFIQFLDGKYAVCDNPLPGIPNEAKIVSMEGSYSDKEELDIAVAMVMKDGSSSHLIQFYLNWDLEDEIWKDREDCNLVTMDVNCIPYGLFKSTLVRESGTEAVWLLSGSDSRIQIYRKNRDLDGQMTVSCEGDSSQFFPEFDLVPGITLHLDIFYAEDFESRWSAVSCEGGMVHLFHVTKTTSANPSIVSHRNLQFDFPASSLRIFERRPKMCQLETGSCKSEPYPGEKEGPLVLVTTALESGFIFDSSGDFSESFPLPESDAYDVITSCLVSDIDYDGLNEVVIGTYGQVVLIYKETSHKSMKWVLHQTLSLPAPVLSIGLGDVLGDGGHELVVQTMTSLHVFQLDPVVVSSLLMKRLPKLIIEEN